MRLAQLFAAWVEAEPGWEVVAPHPFSTVCFRHTGRDNFELARAATATGELFVAATPAARRGMRSGSRSATAATTEDDVRRAWEVLRRMRAVIFDLWETLIDWDQEAAARMVDRIDALAGPGFRERWYAAAEPLPRSGADRAGRGGRAGRR